MTTRTIQREAGDTAKGFTLQKLRATSLMLSHFSSDRSIDFVAAVEYGGDVYVENERLSYVEENKAYDSKNFSFASPEIRNTLVYFLDYWLKNERNSAITFGFYTTNNIAREITAGAVKELSIELPAEPILELLIAKKYDETDLLPAVKKLILNEYKTQYNNNKNFTLEESHYTTLEKFGDKEWIAFLDTIKWKFQQDDIEALENKVVEQIGKVTFPGLSILGKERFIRAELFYELEVRQNKKKSAERFIDKNFIELTFRRVATDGINENSYRYLNLDYDEMRHNTKQNLVQLISDKYRAITGNKIQPKMLPRKVALFDPGIKIKSSLTEAKGRDKDYLIEGPFSFFVNSEKPVFLFGELGSGKSTLSASYLLSFIDANPAIVPIFIPSSYLQEKEFNDAEGFIKLINRYVNNELLLTDKFFDLDTALKTNKELILVIDGIDELLISRSRILITVLKKLKDSSSHVRVIATGRPLELESVLPAGWHTLVTIPLNEDEIKAIFIQEAIANNIPESEAPQDAEKRLGFLKKRNELYAITSTPLIACSIWPDLTEELEGKTLGDILYDVLLRSLSWHEKDQKGLDLKFFLEYFPNVYQREELLAAIAREIFYSPTKAIPDSVILKIASSKIAESAEKNKIAHEAVAFYKSAFLQPTTESRYGFISAPLLECAVAIALSEELRSAEQVIDFSVSWRALSFAMAVSRRKEEINDIRDNVFVIVSKELKWPNINVAPIAIIIAESKDPELCGYFIELLQTMEYRPIRVLEHKDQLTLYSLAYCITLAGDNGFDWFFAEYLTCKTPLIHYEAKMVSDILGYYFLINDFKLPKPEKDRLTSIIQPNISFATSLCFELLPCLSLITTDEVSVDQKCLLLTDLLKDDVLHDKAETTLKEMAASNMDPVLNALEIVCQKTDLKENPRPALLWLEINKDRPLSMHILSNALMAITRMNLEEIVSALSHYVKEDDLYAYLRFCIVSGDKLAGQASLILFWKGDTNFELLSNGLINSIDWLSRQYGQVNEIADFIAAKKDTAVAIL